MKGQQTYPIMYFEADAMKVSSGRMFGDIVVRKFNRIDKVVHSLVCGANILRKTARLHYKKALKLKKKRRWSECHQY